MADEVVKTPFGKFLVNERDVVESTLKAGTLWDGPGFLQVIAKEYAAFGAEGATILDIGAHVGSFSIWCAFQGAWRVLAFEPVPQTYQRLQANLDLNKDFCADVVVPIQAAGYDAFTTLLLGPYDAGNTGGTALLPDPHDGGPETQLPAYRLECWHPICGTGVTLVKIDAQGCDGPIIRGLKEIIECCHPAVVFEWETALAAVHDEDLQMTIQWLEARHYKVLAWPSHVGNYLAVPLQAPNGKAH